jgi:hypothetical protein
MVAERYQVNASCSVCGKVVYADQGYHGLSKDHYDCTSRAFDNAVEKYEEANRKLNKMFSDLDITDDSVPKPRRKKRVREGEGKIAQKCIRLATVAFEEATGGKVVSTLIWNQKGQYRGPRWDLAAWGVDFDFTLPGSENIFKGSIASWGTMTAVSKLKEMKISPSNISYMYEY